MGAFYFLGDQLECEDLFVNVNIRPADVDAHFRIVLLIVKAVADNGVCIFSGVMSGPTRSGLERITNTLK